MIDSNSQFFAILTAVGEAKQANATALGTPWTFKEMAIGDANGTDPIPNRTQTKLINEWRRAPVNQVRTDPANPNIIITEQVIPPDVGGRWIREIGLLDADGDLVAVANCAPSFKPLLAQGTGKTQVIRMNFIVANTAQIVLKIDPAVVLATRQYVDDSLVAALPPDKKAGTFHQVTIDKRGLVVSGGNPTTLAGYGITDALTKPETTSAIQQAIANLVAAAPASLDTLKELADALGNDPNFATTMTNALAGKAAKSTTLSGYGISDSYTAIQVNQLLSSKVSLGVYGLGGAAPDFPGNDLNTKCDTTSWFRTTSGCLNCPPGANPQGSIVRHEVWTPGVVQQTFREHVTAREWHRAATSNTFGAWVEVVSNMVGAIQAFACTNAPTGWLVADGSQVLRANYPALLAITNGAFGWGNGTTTFNLPDMRAEVIRGLDLGRGINAGRALGSIELDAMQGHGHFNTNQVIGSSGGSGEFLSHNNGVSSSTSANRILAPADLAGFGAVRVATETRMRNVALLYCIKY
ncbi:phage tail protein [Pseudomonas protegens]|uniref:phage tail-collar fiber domain-containing protein n=1 Tax=Pseudomonas protegens TaxID=380021 RepID=UPI001E44A8FD|nr:phage tail protein [Pseudomonas protegens]MCD9569431.1 phage tail protein [Pseudomonas protegens]